MTLQIAVTVYGNPVYTLVNARGYRTVFKGIEAYEFDKESYLQYWDGKIRQLKSL